MVPQVRPNLRQRLAPAAAAAGAKGHLDEVILKIHGNWPYLWRAVDQHGNVLAS